MVTRDPLTEMSNQRQPRPKFAQTYGKRKGGNVSTQAAHKQLFGQNENDIEGRLASISLDEPKDVSSTTNKKTNGEEKNKFSVANSSTKKSIVSQEDSDALAPLLVLSDTPLELFTTFGNKIAKSCIIEKIGEGSFAEVFKVTPVSSKATGASSLKNLTTPAVSSIIKVIPLAHPTSSSLVADRVSSVNSVAREINLLKHLAILHGFTGFASLRLVKGIWPDSFLESFYDFRTRHRKRAINEAPDKCFDENQIYALVEMDDAGTEIALIRRPSVFQVYDIFWMTVILLVNAEEQLEFEHRDLHLSNICVKRSVRGEVTSALTSACEDNLDIDPLVLASMTKTPDVRLGYSNLDITIIDYTVARARLSLSSPRKRSRTASSTLNARSSPASKSQLLDSSTYTAFDPMSFASQPFQPSSDPETSLQFSTYKKCLAVACSACKQQGSVQDKWSQHLPRTNVVWLGYLLRVLIRRARGRTGKLNIVNPKSRTPSGRTSTKGNQVSKKIQEDMWESLCDVDVVLNGGDEEVDDDNDHSTDISAGEAGSRREETWSREELDQIPEGAGELLKKAVGEGWLMRQEIEAFKLRLEERS